MCSSDLGNKREPHFEEKHVGAEHKEGGEHKEGAEKKTEAAPAAH